MQKRYTALLLTTLVTCLWVIWGVPEMFHEGWYSPFEWLFFLLPAICMLVLSLIALRWPRFGALVYACIGLGFGALVLWQFRPGGGRSTDWTPGTLLSWVPVTVFLVLVAGAVYRARDAYRRPAHYVIAVCTPLLLGIALAVMPAYRLAQRIDDGDRGERFIAGNGVALYWAPAGPGWDRDGGVSWNELALYGREPVGFTNKRFGIDGQCNGAGNWAEHCATMNDMRAYNICLYLNREGTELMADKQGIWRLPTVDELVRSLVHHGNQAGCVWSGSEGRQPCVAQPDKETPLWDPTARVIYYWTADEANPGSSYEVVYQGNVLAVPKFMVLGSRGFRCVRE